MLRDSILLKLNYTKQNEQSKVSRGEVLLTFPQVMRERPINPFINMKRSGLKIIFMK